MTGFWKITSAKLIFTKSKNVRLVSAFMQLSSSTGSAWTQDEDLEQNGSNKFTKLPEGIVNSGACNAYNRKVLIQQPIISEISFAEIRKD